MPTTGFIDIHNHILPKLDEGSSCIEESAQMLQIARDDGISGIVATPHILDGVYNNIRENIGKKLVELNEVHSSVQVYIGAEVRINRNLELRISNNELPLLNDKKFLLLELPTYVLPPILELENIIKTRYLLILKEIYQYSMICLLWRDLFRIN